MVSSFSVENFAYWCIPCIFINVITSNNLVNNEIYMNVYKRDYMHAS